MGPVQVVRRVPTDIRAGLLGFIFGAWLIGFRNLSPRSLEWLSADARLAQLGYQFFWRSSWWQFPLDSTPNFGVGWGVGLNQNAYNSLLALILKPVAVFFPDGFQFQGVWIAVCFAMHVIIARRLFVELRLERGAQILGVVVVTLTPALFSRIGTLWHPQLAAHWMILLALLLYLRNARPLWWSLFCVYALSVHVYLFLIIFAVALASLCKQPLLRESSGSVAQRFKSPIANVFGILLPVAVALFVFGFGTFLTNSSIAGVGFFRMNLLAFINPARENYGYLMGQLPFFVERTWITEENEGFAYLGLGVIITGIALLAFVLSARVRLQRQYWPLAVVTVLLFAVALSERLAIGGREFTLPVPIVLIELRQAVRAATRFAWLALYLLVILGWWALANLANRYLNKRAASLALLVVAILQVVDVGPGVVTLRNEVSQEKGNYAPDLGSEWSTLFEQYDNVKIVPSIDPNEDDMDYLPDEREWLADNRLFQLAWLAAFNDIQLNYAFCSRPCVDLARESTATARSELASGNLTPGTIYLFSTEAEWENTSNEWGLPTRRIDGFFAILGPTADNSTR